MIHNVIDIAKKASKEILKIYRQDNYDINTKDDNSPVTRADLVSNAIIIQELQYLSNYPILTEETPIEYEIRKMWPTYWLVDPLDGTKDFIAKNDEFTINIALMNNNIPILGVIYVPVLGDVYYAERGKGAYKNGQKIFNHSTRIELIGADSNFHSTNEIKVFFEKHKIKHIKKFGAALKMCKLAEGVIDIYPRLNGTKEWDTAAAHIIANEAGCKLLDINTKQELIYNKQNIKNNHFIAYRSSLDHKVLNEFTI